MHHYKCYTCYIPKTRLERITDTVLYFPSNVPILAFDAKAHLHQALEDNRHRKKSLENPPYLTAGDDTTNAIHIVAETLQRSPAQPSQHLESIVPHLVENFQHTTRIKLFRPDRVLSNIGHHFRGCQKTQSKIILPLPKAFETDMTQFLRVQMPSQNEYFQTYTQRNITPQTTLHSTTPTKVYIPSTNLSENPSLSTIQPIQNWTNFKKLRLNHITHKLLLQASPDPTLINNNHIHSFFTIPQIISLIPQQAKKKLLIRFKHHRKKILGNLLSEMNGVVWRKEMCMLSRPLILIILSISSSPTR